MKTIIFLSKLSRVCRHPAGIKCAHIILAAAVLGCSSLQAGVSPADKRKAAHDAQVAKMEEMAAKVQAHFDFLKTYLPRLTAADIKGKSAADLRALYYDAYRKQGMSNTEAQAKAKDTRLD